MKDDDQKLAEQATAIAQEMYAADFSKTVKALVQSDAVIHTQLAILSKQIESLIEKVDLMMPDCDCETCSPPLDPEDSGE